ncbi:MAG: glycosyltransferase family 2 protein [Patescibacteria group bacterium]
MSDRDRHVCVNIVTWNSENYIADLLDSLKKQTFSDFDIVIIDNASSDKTLEIASKYENVIFIKNSSNLGFSRAHNKGIEMAMKFWQGKDLRERFVVVCNPDIILAPDCLEKLLVGICKNGSAGLAGPKLLRMQIEESDNIMENKKSEIIDSLGIEIRKTRKIVDRLSGSPETNSLQVEEVFGISGAFMCLRASALQSVKWEREYFDEKFFAYKEDVDLSWRLKNLGWQAVVVPDATAYHHRRVKGEAKASFFERLKNKGYQSKRVKFLSIRNHIWTVMKNDFGVNYFLDLPFIIFEEIGKFVYCLFFDFTNLKAYFSALGGLPEILKKRAYLKNAKIPASEIREWIK